MTNRDIALIGLCGLLLGSGCVMDDAETQGRSGVPRKASVPIKTMMECDGLEPLLRDLVKQTANPQGAASSQVAVPAKVSQQKVLQAQQANATLRQDGYTFRTNDAGEAIILEFEKGYSGALAITNVLGGCRVTGIGIRAFQNCARLTDIVIPSSVTSIGEAAFEFCHGLTRVSVPATVTSMGGNPFGGCHRLLAVSVEAANPAYVSNGEGVLFTKDMTELICYPAGKSGDYVIPDGVTRLGRGAFLFCPQLTRVVMPNSVTMIGDCVFFICPRLTQVTLSENVIRIGMQAFESCNGLKELTIPASVNHLVSWAFRGCGNLASVYFKGDAPGGSSDNSVFSGADNATVYYRPGTKGWGPTFSGRPTAVWDMKTPRPGSARPDVESVEITRTKGDTDKCGETYERVFLVQERAQTTKVESTGEAKQFCAVAGMTSVLDDEVYVYKRAGVDINVYSLSGELKRSIRVPSEITYSTDLVVLPDKRIAILANSNDTIYILDAQGNLLKAIAFLEKPDNHMQNLSGIAVDNRLIVSETGNKEIIAVDLSTYEVSTFRKLYELHGWLGSITYDNGTYYLCQSKDIYSFKEKSVLITKVATVPEGNITGIVANKGRLIVVINGVTRERTDNPRTPSSGKSDLGVLYEIEPQSGRVSIIKEGLGYPGGVFMLNQSTRRNEVPAARTTKERKP